MAVLDRLIKEHEDFDPSNSEHRKAYLMLQFQGRQHPTLRFVLPYPHSSVLHHMQHELTKALCQKEIFEMGIDTTYKVAEENERFVDFPAVIRKVRS